MTTATKDRNGQSTATGRRFAVTVEPSDTAGREILKIDVECEFETIDDFSDWLRACADKTVFELAVRERVKSEDWPW